MNDLHVKLTDFGMASITANCNSQAGDIPSVHGTSYYEAPEVVVEGKPAQTYSDVWSGSLLGLEWFTGTTTWKLNGPNNHHIMKKNKVMPTTHLHKVPDAVRRCLTKGLNYTTDDRPSAQQMVNLLQNV